MAQSAINWICFSSIGLPRSCQLAMISLAECLQFFRESNVTKLIRSHDKLDLPPLCATPSVPASNSRHAPVVTSSGAMLPDKAANEKYISQQSHTLPLVCLLWPRKLPASLWFPSQWDAPECDGHALLPPLPGLLFFVYVPQTPLVFSLGFETHFNENWCPLAGGRGHGKSSIWHHQSLNTDPDCRQHLALFGRRQRMDGANERRIITTENCENPWWRGLPAVPFVCSNWLFVWTLSR